MQQHYIAWWNLENLFNEENDPSRSEWLQNQLKRELRGWTKGVLNKKLNQLASIISLLNDGKGPDILGVCEVENKSVLQKLTDKLAPLNRNYGISLHEGEDKRGIDVAIIFDKNKFTAAEQFTHRIMKRNATRDIFQVNFKTSAGKDLVVIGNHWPARMPGTYESDPYRIIAAETLSYWIKRITEIMGKDVRIIVMGDFNDDPFGRAMTDYALSTSSKQKVVNSRSSPRLYNLMAAEIARGVGSYYHSGPYLFDQLLVSKGLIKSTSPLKVKAGSPRVENIDIMAKGSYKAPRRFARPSTKSSYNPDGYSDHFPVSVVLEEK